MAITKMSSKSFVNNVESGNTCVTQKAVRKGETMQIYVPRLMPYMVKGSPVQQSVVTNGNMAFANDSSCKPNAPSVVRTQNYISPKFNGSWDGIVADPDEDPVPSGTSVQITFPSGNLLSPTFTPQ